MTLTAIGQDSHRFEPNGSTKPLILGGVRIPGCVGLAGNSDADVILHALTNAVSGITTVNILGAISDDLCLNRGITDSSVYLVKALEGLGNRRLVHISISVEAKRPILAPHIPAIRASIAKLVSLSDAHVGLTATSGEGLTAFGMGEGIQALVVVSVEG